jgi:hypothetical protein
MQLILKKKIIEVESFEEASRIFCKARGHKHPRFFPDATIRLIDGPDVARISYNGNVWEPKVWEYGDEPILRVPAGGWQ